MKIFKGREFLRILEASVVICESVFYVCVCVCVSSETSNTRTSSYA